MTPDGMALKLYDACKAEGMSEVDASIKVMQFLTEALGFAISVSCGSDDANRVETQRMIADMIVKMPRHPLAPTTQATETV
jgi:hypothetical protein